MTRRQLKRKSSLFLLSLMFAIYKTCKKQQSFKHKKVEMLRKTVTGYHGLVSELLLQDKEFRMLLGMNTETYEVSKFMLISMCATMWERGRVWSNLVKKFVP